jgi:hypothetical protein
VERKRAGEQHVNHRLYAEREDAECMAELQAAELLPVGATAITGTATSPPKPRNSAVSCRLHGGASGSGGPPGERNGQYRHGERTKATIAERQKFSTLLKMLRTGLT